ncbi:hypothetical protein M1328_04780 [Patescibacteria group bacterium]|nr:hypothetical protein [Patescibacteria group bacterium]
MGHLENYVVSSAGHPGFEVRSPLRAYGIPSEALQTPEALVSEQKKLLEFMDVSSASRRGVLRARTNLLSLESALVESPLNHGELAEIGGTDDFIVTFAQNNKLTNPEKVEIQSKMSFITKPVEQLLRPSLRVESLQKTGEYYLSDKLTQKDAQDLMKLWWVFGWTWKGINDFIEQFNASANSPWFSGVRDRNGRLVSAVQGDKIEYADHLSVEVTEFSTLEGHEGKSLCTAALTGLIAQIIRHTLVNDDPIKDKNPKNLPVLIYSELNIDSTSFYVAQSLGFESPSIELNGKIIDQTLRENVYVLEKTPELEQLWMTSTTEEQEAMLANPDFYESHLRNFVMMHMPSAVIETLFNIEEVDQILKFYNQFN